MTGLLLTGARVIDPESGHDGIADVLIEADRIVSVGPAAAKPPRTRTIALDGLVLAPGFIDLHSHALTEAAMWLQAFDGVTTALDLESGAHPHDQVTARFRAEGRPINWGHSAGWALARAQVVTGVGYDARRDSCAMATLLEVERHGDWTTPLSATQLSLLGKALEDDLDDGALGIGVLLGYAPLTPAEEYGLLSEAAAERSSSVWTHIRWSTRYGDVTSMDGLTEVIETARRTGAHHHVCHLHSTASGWLADQISALATARLQGVPVTTEVYPYHRGCTVIGASFLTPQGLAEEGREPRSLTLVASGRDISDAEELLAWRRQDPSALVLTTSFDLDDPAERADYDAAMLLDSAAFASDSVLPMMPDGNPAPARGILPAQARAHPRGAGCFASVFADLVRGRGLLTLTEAVRRCSLLPAQILERACPATRRKGGSGRAPTPTWWPSIRRSSVREPTTRRCGRRWGYGTCSWAANRWWPTDIVRRGGPAEL